MNKYKLILALLVLSIGYYYIAMKKADLLKSPIQVKPVGESDHAGHNHSDHDSFAPQSSYPKVEKEFDKKRFESRFPGNWQYSFSRDNYQVLVGGKIPLKVNMDGAVIALTQKVVAEFGIDPKQVSPQVDRFADSKREKNFRLFQHHNGMLVYGAEYLMMALKPQNEIAVIENGFKKIEHLNLAQKLRPEEAGAFLSKEGNKLLSRGETMIFVKRGKGVAAYRFEYVDGKGERKETLLSATTGEFLFTKEILSQ